jgi:hypothetical protein
MILDENTSFRNTIQSVNEKDNVNYLADSNTNSENLFFRTNLIHNTKVPFQKSENIFEDAENKYVESSNRLFDTVIQSLDYFKKISDFSLKNDDKILKVKILKDNYDKLSQDYELILKENQKLKEKNKFFKEKSQNSNFHSEVNTSCSSTSAVNNLNLNKFIDSLMYLQTKNEDLEKENKTLIVQVEGLKEKLKFEKKKRLSEEKISSNRSKLINTKSQNTLHTQKNKNDQMELLLKEQITCMQKMLVIVQDSKESTGNTNSSVSVTIFYNINFSLLNNLEEKEFYRKSKLS